MYVPHAEHNLPHTAFGREERADRRIAKTIAAAMIRNTTFGNGSPDMLPHSHLVRHHRTKKMPRPLYIDGIFILNLQPSSHQERVAMAVMASSALVVAWATIASVMRPERRAAQA